MFSRFRLLNISKNTNSFKVRSFSSSSSSSAPAPRRTVLHPLHVRLGGRIVDFAGYELPVQYPDGMITNHVHVRTKAGLFDVSHMGQLKIRGAKRAEFLETLVVSDILGLGVNNARLSSLTNEKGGIIDDCMITNKGDYIYMVINAGCKEKDMAHLNRHLLEFNAAHGSDVTIENFSEQNELIALQGPAAADALAKLLPSSISLSSVPFMSNLSVSLSGVPCLVSRSGYTGEDGFEISVPGKSVIGITEQLLSDERVKPAGLGVRDSLRLEAGLCLYGHDMTEDITPVEAGLLFTIGKRRRLEGGFLGHSVIVKQIAEGITKKRIGFIIPKGPPAREESVITLPDGTALGRVTSGAYSPSLSKPIGMGYVDVTPGVTAKSWPEPGTSVKIIVRGKPVDATIAKLPFVPTKYYKPT